MPDEDQMSADREAITVEMDAIIGAKDEIIAKRQMELGTNIAEKDEIAADKDAVIAAIIAEKDAIIAAKDAIIAKLQMEIARVREKVELDVQTAEMSVPASSGSPHADGDGTTTVPLPARVLVHRRSSRSRVGAPDLVP